MHDDEAAYIIRMMVCTTVIAASARAMETTRSVIAAAACSVCLLFRRVGTPPDRDAEHFCTLRLRQYSSGRRARQ